MPVSILTSKGQMTIPKEVRVALRINASDRVLISIEGNHAILKPIRGNILDLAGSMKAKSRGKRADFKNMRDVVKSEVASRAVSRGGSR
jgi:AbrB family looped-hinge helix DNA binding protein